MSEWDRERERAASYLVLLLEAVSFGALHLGDVLQEVGHADGRVQLACLVRDALHRSVPIAVALTLLLKGVCQRVRMRLHQATGVTAHRLALVCQREGMSRGRGRLPLEIEQQPYHNTDNFTHFRFAILPDNSWVCFGPSPVLPQMEWISTWSGLDQYHTQLLSGLSLALLSVRLTPTW